MTRILLRAGKDPRQGLTPEASLAFGGGGVFGTNVGNVAFADATFRLLSVPGTEVVPNAYLTERAGKDREYIARLNDEFDVFVLPLANAFRESFLGPLRALTSVIRELTIPVVVVGVGAQARLDGQHTHSDDLIRATKQFMSAVLDRSARVGLRGETTREYLRGLGFGDAHTAVIGCPSVYLRDEARLVTKKVAAIERESLINLTLSPYVAPFADFVNRAAAQYPNLIYVAQRSEDLDLMLWGREFGASPNPKMPVHRGHRLYREDKMRFFCDSRTWLDFNETREYSVGTRIHGSVMALVAGTPATLVAHDSRTLEIARYHDIPHMLLSEIARTDTVADLYARSDWTAFNAGKPRRFEVLTAFLEANGLEHIAQDGKSNPAFEDAWRKAKLPRPVHTPYAPEDEFRAMMIDRLAWLSQTAGPAGERARDRYCPPLPLTPKKPPAPKPPPSLPRRIARAVKRRLPGA
ncbi:MAG: polysaccharide pyruvyl transferase family protein [Bifidobacteriaceae bacterium]|nr:polysaccharide pyruvyl transferase family protein [Bifidobacteriaceae bacterium]